MLGSERLQGGVAPVTTSMATNDQRVKGTTQLAWIVASLRRAGGIASRAGPSRARRNFLWLRMTEAHVDSLDFNPSEGPN